MDPTINALFQRMKDELDSVKQRLKQSQEDLSAATFTRERSIEFSSLGPDDFDLTIMRFIALLAVSS